MMIINIWDKGREREEEEGRERKRCELTIKIGNTVEN